MAAPHTARLASLMSEAKLADDRLQAFKAAFIYPNTLTLAVQAEKQRIGYHVGFSEQHIVRANWQA